MRQTCCSFSATASSAQATTLAAGWRSAISLARLGPETTAMRSGPAPVTSAITSLIRRVVPSSIPFIRLTRTQSGGRSATQALEVAAQRLRRDGEHHHLGAARAPRAASVVAAIGLRQRDARQVVGVLVGGGDGVAPPPAGGPRGRRRRRRRRAPWRTRCPTSRSRAPRPASCRSSLVSCGSPGRRRGSRGSPVTGRPCCLGSNRSAGACSPRISSSSSVIAAMMRSVTSCSSAASTGRSRTSSRSTGGPAQTCMVLRGKKCGRLV